MKILIAEDDITSRRILESILGKWGYDVISAKDGNEAWEILQGPEPPGLVILDWMMPGMEGIEICRRLRENNNSEKSYTYLILLTAKGSKENIVTGMDAGADDYVVKPFDQHELRVRVRAGERIVQLHSELLSTKQELLIQTRTDPLTGILNRRALFSVIEKELSRSLRTKQKLSLAMLDIDHFKKVNDSYGHLAGDEVLKEVTKRISKTLRSYDFVGRFGGEEFVVVLLGIKENDACITCERIRSAIADEKISVKGSDIYITASLGVVTWDGKTSIDALLDLADKALYRAKENGRNRVEQAVIEV